MTLAELAEGTGIPARTVRYYIARGLLPGPDKAGRGAEYNEQHLERLQQIVRLQAEGHPLAEIARLLDSGPGSQPPTPTAWWCYPVADDVQVWMREGTPPWRTRQIREAILGLTRILEKRVDHDN